MCPKFELAINSLYFKGEYVLPDTLGLQRLGEFLMDNISNLTSPNKVSQLMTANEKFLDTTLPHQAQ